MFQRTIEQTATNIAMLLTPFSRELLVRVARSHNEKFNLSWDEHRLAIRGRLTDLGDLVLQKLSNFQ